jgi:transcriptional regulator with XRE-family HTH domain
VRAMIDTFGLRRELARRGMTQPELASIAGVSEPTVCHAMAGRMVSYLTIRKFARALTVTPVLPGTEGIIGTQKEVGIRFPTPADADGGEL